MRNCRRRRKLDENRTGPDAREIEKTGRERANWPVRGRGFGGGQPVPRLGVVDGDGGRTRAVRHERSRDHTSCSVSAILCDVHYNGHPIIIFYYYHPVRRGKLWATI